MEMSPHPEKALAAAEALRELVPDAGHLIHMPTHIDVLLGFDETLPRACRHPRNVWSLHGYHECLTRLGRRAQAAALGPQLERALTAADVEIESSCFCRTGGARGVPSGEGV